MDQVQVPLASEAVTGPSDLSNFTDSISPIQQHFVKMFRDAQSESPVFSICVVQIKGQLEKVLGLPPETLSNDVRLNQDIISLFVDYQIPSDLMSYKGLEESTAEEKVTFVRFEGVSAWCEKVQDFFSKRVDKEIMSHVMIPRAEYKNKIPELSTITANSIFCRILPLLEHGKPSNDATSVSNHTTLSVSKSVCSVLPYEGPEESPLLSVNAIGPALV